MHQSIRHTVLAAVLLATSVGCAASEDRNDEIRGSRLNAGIVLQGDASSKSVGLPIMPGAVRRKKNDDDGNALTFALWGGDFGFKVAVLGLTTDEPIEDVADYYKSQLERYGTVLDCSREQARTRVKGEKKVLTCDDSKPRKGRLVYKVGTPNNHRLVKIEPSGAEVHVDLVRVLATVD